MGPLNAACSWLLVSICSLSSTARLVTRNLHTLYWIPLVLIEARGIEQCIFGGDGGRTESMARQLCTENQITLFKIQNE